ncbi:hypothetical protein AVEN_114285-1 [Araneus ventricosus]|uniref:CUB domain-containing protein n=1 Tax=Araneus ventricosus TaxID=182803 RepID=A0A4Y2MLT6_ARAVE|nr:hypothetical protein AVEN_114285-1 [Araneus ventricosus]
MDNLSNISSHFDRPQAEDCTYPKGGPGGLISPEDISKSILNYSLTWKVPLDCTWVIKVQEGWKVRLLYSVNAY